MRHILKAIIMVGCCTPMTWADGVDDLVVYRPSNGQFVSGWTELSGTSYLLSFANGSSLQFGTADYDPLIGDVNGDGLGDLLIYNRTNGRWVSGITLPDGTLTNTGSDIFGPYLVGDIARLGDVNADGRVDILIYRPSNGQWISAITDAAGNLTGSGMIIQFGTPDYDPLVGDVNADGRADLLIYNRTNGRWVCGLTGPGGTLTNSGFDLYGPFLAGDIPQAGDLNGDGRTDLLVYRPSDGAWYSGITDETASAVAWSPVSLQFGTADYRPLVGDVNNDGRTDLLIYNTTNGRWISGLTAPGGVLTSIGSEVYGPFLVGDVPVVGDVGGSVPPPACYDHDGDTDVDMDDFAAFQLCFAGAGRPIPSDPPGCACYDKGGGLSDKDIDVDDFIAFAACASGASIPAPPECR